MSQESKPQIMRVESRRGVLALLMGSALLLGACGSSTTSSAKTTTTRVVATTTLPQQAVTPLPPNASAVSGYLKSPTNAFVTFEEATASISHGAIPSRTTCENTAKGLAGQAPSNPNAVASSIKGIPNIAIQVDASQDMQNKLLFLTHCMNGTATLKEAATVQDSASVVTQLLKQLGVTLSQSTRTG